MIRLVNYWKHFHLHHPSKLSLSFECHVLSENRWCGVIYGITRVPLVICGLHGISRTNFPNPQYLNAIHCFQLITICLMRFRAFCMVIVIRVWGWELEKWMCMSSDVDVFGDFTWGELVKCVSSKMGIFRGESKT